MNKKLFLIFSHILTEDQKNDATQNHQITEFISLPKELQAKWSQVPAILDLDVKEYIKEIVAFITEKAEANDLVLVQGDFGATYNLVSTLKSNHLECVYAITKRESIEKHLGDGTVELHKIFKHAGFRRY